MINCLSDQQVTGATAEKGLRMLLAIFMQAAKIAKMKLHTLQKLFFSSHVNLSF